MLEVMGTLAPLETDKENPGAQQNVEPQAGGELFQDIQFAGASGSGCRPTFGGVGLAELCGCFLAATDEIALGGLVSLGKPETLERHLDQALDSLRLCVSDPIPRVTSVEIALVFREGR